MYAFVAYNRPGLTKLLTRSILPAIWQKFCFKFDESASGHDGLARFTDRQMNNCAERANPHPNPPHNVIAAIGIVKATAQPDPKKGPQLVTKKHNSIKRAHIAQPI